MIKSSPIEGKTLEEYYKIVEDSCYGGSLHCSKCGSNEFSIGKDGYEYHHYDYGGYPVLCSKCYYIIHVKGHEELINKRKNYDKWYRDKNRDYNKQRNKEWHKQNKEHNKLYRLMNKDKRRDYNKQRNSIPTVKKHMSNTHKQWRKKNPNYHKQWYIKNKQKHYNSVKHYRLRQKIFNMFKKR